MAGLGSPGFRETAPNVSLPRIPVNAPVIAREPHGEPSTGGG